MMDVRASREPDDVQRMRARLQAMETERALAAQVNTQARDMLRPSASSSSLAGSSGRPIPHPQPSYRPPVSLPPSASEPLIVRRPLSSSGDGYSDTTSSRSSSSSSEDEEDDDEGPSGDSMLQMMRLQTLIQSAGRGSSSQLVHWLMNQRGPPSDIMRDFEAMLRAQVGEPDRPSPAPAPSRLPTATPSIPIASRADPRLAAQFDALAQASVLNPDGTPSDGSALRAGLGMGIHLARGMSDAAAPSSQSNLELFRYRPPSHVQYEDSSDEDVTQTSYNGHTVDTRQWFRDMRDEAAGRLGPGSVVSRLGATHVSSGPVRTVPAPSRANNTASRAILLVPMQSLEDQIQAIASSIAASFNTSSAQAAEPKPAKRRVANVPDTLPTLTDKQDSVWKCDKCGNDNDMLQQSCVKCFGPAPAKMSAPLPTALSIVPAKPADECVICFDGPKDTLLAPCGHVCCCISCANTLLEANENCPVCRSFIENAYKVFTV